ncbi:MAG: efflux RND transporter periplasmic adaptor subunit, partial [Alphaproteobacteria bacterium]
MADGRPSKFRRLAFIPPVIIGIIILALVLRTREGPQREALSEQVTLVRTVQVQVVDMVPRAVGFGTVRPEKEWSAVAQVAGKVIELNPHLQRGAIVSEGTLLLRIDPTDYELAIARADANLASVEAEISALASTTENLRASRDIASRSLVLSERDLERKNTLRQRGTIADAALDAQERAVLTSRQRVQDIDNSLALLPAEQRLLRAKQSLAEAQREEARLDLARTQIRAPFDLRLADIRIERTQFVRQGDTLVQGDSITAAEIEAQYPLTRILPLVSGSGDLDVNGLSPAELGQIADQFGLAATVTLQTGDISAQWPAKVSRGSDTIDLRTRAFGIIVTVAEPIRSARPGQRPPLVKGMLVEVVLTGRPQPDTL